MGAHAYAVTNALAGLAAGAFTWSNAATADRTKLNDGRMDSRMNVGSVSSGVNVIIDLGAATSLVGFAVLNCNIVPNVSTHTPKLLIEADTGAGFGTAVTAKALTTLYTTAPKNKDHVLQFPAVSKRYWRLTWSWSGGGSAGFSIGEIFAITASTQLTRRSVYGSGEQQDYIVSQLEMQYGETRSSFMAGPIRQLNLDWEDLTASQRDELQAMWTSTNGSALPLLWIQSYEASANAAAAAEQECIYGRLTKPSFGWKESDYSLYQPDGFSIRSLGREAGA